MSSESKTMDIGDFFAEMEAEAHARAQVERAAEDAAWEALGAEGRARVIAEREARWAALDAEPDEPEEEEEEEDEEEEEEDE